VTWDPTQYLKYADERRRPALDLIARIPLEAPTTIVDVGCGAGNVTSLLAERWPRTRVIGIDNSSAMLARARHAVGGDPRFEWIEADAATWSPRARVDLIFSNAALHWVDDHAALFPRLFAMVAPGGALAVQMPANHAAPSHTLLAEVANSARWRDRLGTLLRPAPVAPAATYFSLLAPHAHEVDIWTTEYLHVLPAAKEGEHPVVAWTRGTTLTPLLAALGVKAQRAFLDDYAASIAAAYPALGNGRVLFPFRRVFIVATCRERQDDAK
jgi:trans-aconitate 2-methyltransferase